jgi:uncharacterized protein (TIGR03083 family)
VSSRPLRQFYGDDRTLVLDGLPGAVEPFRRHRQRFLESLRSLTDDEWAATTRCDAWSATDICHHLVTADGFWSLTLAGRGNAEPTTFLRGFDPTTSPGAIIAPLREQPAAAALEGLAASTDQLLDTLSAIGDDEWTARSESPFGHVSLPAIAAHALWDSWLHERDVMVPLGRPPAVEDDELVIAAAFTLFVGATQGGVLDDASAVGDGPAAPIDGSVTFDDLPGRAFCLVVDRDVRVSVESETFRAVAPTAVGSAVTFVEAVTGRAPLGPTLARFPVDVAAQLQRARQIL